MPHHRRAQGQDPSSQHSSAAPVARRNLVAPDTAASHEDTSSDRSGAKFACAARQATLRFAKRGPCGPSLSASVTSQLSLHPSINTPPRVTPQRCLVIFSERRRRFRRCLGRQQAGAMPTGDALLRREAYAAPVARRSAASPVVEVNGFEPMTSCLQSRRSPS